MSLDQWEFGVKPELVETRFVKIHGKRFPLEEVLGVLGALLTSDIMTPINISSRELAEALVTEGMAYPVAASGGHGGTEQTEEAFTRLYDLKDAELRKHANPTLKTGYMCSTAFDHELEKTNTEISPSSSLIDCTSTGYCAIIKVYIHAVEVVEEDAGT